MNWESFMFLHLICMQNLGQGQQPEKSVEGLPLTSAGSKTKVHVSVWW